MSLLLLLKHQKDPKLKAVTSKELNALVTNATWDLVPSQLRHNSMGCKYAYSVKFNSQGLVQRYKARLFTFGNHQQANINYHETFNLLMKTHPLIFLELSLALTSNWAIQRLMLRMLLSMVISLRKFTLNNFLGCLS